MRLDVRNRIARRFLLALPLRGPRRLLGLSNRRLTRTGLLEYYYEKYLYGDTSLFELPETPALHILATNLSEGCLCSFNRDGLLMMRRQPGNSVPHRPHPRRPGDGADGGHGLVRLPRVLPAPGADRRGCRRQRRRVRPAGVHRRRRLRQPRRPHVRPAWNGRSWPRAPCRETTSSTSRRSSRRCGKPASPARRRRWAGSRRSSWPSGGDRTSPCSPTPARRAGRGPRPSPGPGRSRSCPDRLTHRVPATATRVVLSVLWDLMRHYPFHREPLFAGLRPVDPDAEALLRASRQGGRVLDGGDQLWLNRHLLEAAFRQATGQACFRRLDSGLDGVLVSDVGKPISVQGNRRAGGLIRTALRATDILMDRVWQLEMETFRGTPGFVFAPMHGGGRTRRGPDGPAPRDPATGGPRPHGPGPLLAARDQQPGAARLLRRPQGVPGPPRPVRRGVAGRPPPGTRSRGNPTRPPRSRRPRPARRSRSPRLGGRLGGRDGRPRPRSRRGRCKPRPSGASGPPCWTPGTGPPTSTCPCWSRSSS